MLMWLQRFPLPATTRLCSAEGHRELVLYRGRSVRYHQKQKKTGFFSNVTTVLPPSAHVGDMGGLYGVQGTIPRPGACPNIPEMARPPHNSGSNQ